MLTKGIRGAITLNENTENAVREGTLELLNAIVEKNNLDIDLISHVTFSLTNDVDAAFPAKFARETLGWSEVAMMCFNETPVVGAIKMCLRVLIVVNCGENFKPEFVYLKDASNLRG